jgi:hypothetical protein
MPISDKWADGQIEEMLERMRNGETLTSISEDPRMPSIQTMANWEDKQDTELGLGITRARAIGYTTRAEKALQRAQVQSGDPQLKRLDFDAERWFLGKMHPKKFGEATMLKHADANGDKLDVAAAINAGNQRVLDADQT